MKVLFINPSVRYYDEPRHVPLGILQLIAILERDHPQIKFQLYDQNAFRVDDVTNNNNDIDNMKTQGYINPYKSPLASSWSSSYENCYKTVKLRTMINHGLKK